MELRNFYYEEVIVKKDCASLILRCDNYMRLHPESKLWLRETDHTYSPIRLESKNVPQNDLEEIMSLCPKCGSPILKETNSCHHYEEYGFSFCEYCYAIEEEDGWAQTIRLLSYLNRIDSKTQSETSVIKKTFNINSNIFFKGCYNNGELDQTRLFNAEKFRLRVLTSNNKLLYLTLNHIRMDVNENLYIEHGNDKSDKVKFAGVYLKERDKKGQRLYQGDIVQFKFAKDYDKNNHKMKGILNSIKKDKGAILFIIGGIDFTYPPKYIINNTIEVIGNIYETSW